MCDIVGLLYVHASSSRNIESRCGLLVDNLDREQRSLFLIALHMTLVREVVYHNDSHCKKYSLILITF